MLACTIAFSGGVILGVMLGLALGGLVLGAGLGAGWGMKQHQHCERVPAVSPSNTSLFISRQTSSAPQQQGVPVVFPCKNFSGFFANVENAGFVEKPSQPEISPRYTNSVMPAALSWHPD